MERPIVYCVATMDTKGAELRYVVDILRDRGIDALAIDVGTGAPPVVEPDVSRGQLIASAAAILDEAIAPPWETTDRGTAIDQMSRLWEAVLIHEHRAGHVAGVLGLGGSGGTSLITRGMRGLPIGVPKLMVTTVASGNVSHYVDCSDMIMMPSVVDIAGLNSVSRAILRNAACAMAGMVQSRTGHSESSPSNAEPERRCIALTMFGVTTPCVTAIRQQLEQEGWDCLTFHAIGTGGRTMEKLVQSGLVQGVLDITTTEVADQVVGGVFPAGEQRFESCMAAGIPYVFSVGALDMVNFGTPDSVPEEFRSRLLYIHNPQVTLMRTTPEENRRCAAFMARRLNQGSAPWTLLLPERGVSALDREGQLFYDQEADAALFDELERLLVTSEVRRIERWPLHINDPEFASACLTEFRRLMQNARQS